MELRVKRLTQTEISRFIMEQEIITASEKRAEKPRRREKPKGNVLRNNMKSVNKRAKKLNKAIDKQKEFASIKENKVRAGSSFETKVRNTAKGYDGKVRAKRDTSNQLLNEYTSNSTRFVRPLTDEQRKAGVRR